MQAYSALHSVCTSMQSDPGLCRMRGAGSQLDLRSDGEDVDDGEDESDMSEGDGADPDLGALWVAACREEAATAKAHGDDGAGGTGDWLMWTDVQTQRRETVCVLTGALQICAVC